MFVRNVQMFSKCIGIDFGMKNCCLRKSKIGKILESDEIKLLNGEMIKEVEERYTYLRIDKNKKLKLRN